MTAIKGATAVVTGAASGIGRALALELAARGCDLALGDRDEAGLAAVAAEIGRDGKRKVTTHRVDVGEPAEIAAFAQEATAAHPALNIVINNAGVALLGQFSEVDQAQMDWLFNINFWGVVHSTRAFLQHLAQKPEAHIVNLSSIFGIVAPPGKRPTPRLNSRCAASPKACAMNCRWRTARCGCRWCIRAASRPTSRAIPAPARA